MSWMLSSPSFGIGIEIESRLNDLPRVSQVVNVDVYWNHGQDVRWKAVSTPRDSQSSGEMDTCAPDMTTL